MWFTDLADPSTLAALAVEAALFGLAIAAGVFSMLVRTARWLARGLAALSVLIGLAGVADAIWEQWTFRYPVTLPGQPSGTYAEPTLVMMVGVAVSSLVAIAAGLVAFRRPGLAGLLFTISGFWTLLSVTRSRLYDPTFPPGNFSGAVVAVVLPTLVLAALLVATWRAEHRAVRVSRPSSLTAAPF
jgi:hypothetical protein